MDETQIDQEALIRQMYGYASSLYKRGMDSSQVKTALIERGLDETNAGFIVDSFEREYTEKHEYRADKDMLYGAMWCVGGIVLTMAHIGFIFWGAIAFGAIQFIRGLVNMLDGNKRRLLQGSF